VSLAAAATASSTDSLSKLKLTERIHASTAATSQAAGVPGFHFHPGGKNPGGGQLGGFPIYNKSCIGGYKQTLTL